MNGFTEAWLREHQARLLRDNAFGQDIVQFTLEKPVKLLNEVLRMHWTERRRYAKALAAQIAQRHKGIILPMQQAAVTVTRYSVREPDHDGLIGGCKLLIDCLLMRSDKHPHGMGYIVDDSPKHLTFKAIHVKAETLKAQGTTVRIERLPNAF